MSFSEGLEAEDNSDINYALMWNALYLGIRGNLVISGCKVEPNSPADLMLDVTAGFVWCGGAKRTVGAVDDLDLTSQQAALTTGQSQFIMILWDQATTSVIALDGVAGATGTIYPPAFDDDSQVLLGLVTLSEADSQIDASDIKPLILFVGQGGYFAGDGEFTGDLVVGGAVTVGGTLGVTGATSFAEDVTLADAKDIKMTRGVFNVSIEAPVLAANRALTLPPVSGNVGLVSDSNYHVFSETEIKAGYADDLDYTAGVLKAKNTNDANIGTGVTLIDYFYTETEIDAGFANRLSVEGDSSTNIFKVPAVYELAQYPTQVSFADGGLGSVKAILQTYISQNNNHLKFTIPLATKKGGKNLVIENVVIYASGDATNYVTHCYLYGLSGTTTTSLIGESSQDIGDTGSESYSWPAQETVGTFNQVWLDVSTISDDQVKIYSVIIEHYYT